MEISCIFSKENFPYISGKETFVYFRKRKPRKNYLYLRKGNFLIFSYKKLFIYFEKGRFRTLAYLELETYSEPWYIQNPSIYRTRSIFRTLIYSEVETYSEHCETSTMKCFAKIAS